MENATSKTVQVTLVFLYNGTYPTQEDPALRTVAIAYLVLCLVVSFVSNVFLLVTIASSYSLRRSPFNLLLANLSAVLLVECLFNMPLALSLCATPRRPLGVVVCTLSAFAVQLVTLEVTFSLALLCAEGVAGVWRPFRFQSYVTLGKQAAAIAAMWVAGIALCIPLLFHSPSFFPDRWGCAPSGYAFGHALFLTIWCYCLMVVLGFGCLLCFGVWQYREYKSQRRKSGMNYTDVFMQGDLWTEWVNFKLVAWLFLFYLILEMPYIVVHQESALKTYPIESSDNSTDFRVVKTSRNEKAFTCFRYLYSCLFALLSFKMRKDIRLKLRALFNCCCERSMVRDHSAGRPPVLVKQEKSTKKDSLVPISLNTPVLYISPDGLCLRQLNPVVTTGKGHHEPRFISYLCDQQSTVDDVYEELPNSSCSEDLTNIERRFSKESDITLPDMGSGFSYLSDQKTPLTDIGAEVIRKPKKTVRFAETLTIFRSPTPTTPTPQWFLKVKRQVSKIPVRKVDKVKPWQVELNFNEEPQGVQQIIKNSEASKSSRTLKAGKRKFSSPPEWKINKLS